MTNDTEPFDLNTEYFKVMTPVGDGPNPKVVVRDMTIDEVKELCCKLRGQVRSLGRRLDRFERIEQLKAELRDLEND